MKIGNQNWTPLSVKDTIALVAPSYAPPADYLQTLQRIKDIYAINFSFDPVAIHPYQGFANTPERCAEYLHHAFLSNAKAVWAIAGGHGATRVVEYFSQTPLPKEFKIFCGYSDTTAIHLYLNAWGWPTFLAPMMAYGKDANPTINSCQTFQQLLDILKGRYSTLQYTFEILNPKPLFTKIVHTPIVGGNFSLIERNPVYSRDVFSKSCIAFFEDDDIGSCLHQLESRISGLKQNGILKNVRGVLLSSFGSQDRKDISLIAKIFDEILEGRVPILFNPDFGHGDYHKVLPLLVNTNIDLYQSHAEVKIDLM